MSTLTLRRPPRTLSLPRYPGSLFLSRASHHPQGCVWIESARLDMPTKKAGGRTLPWECRVAKETYSASMTVVLKCSLRGKTLTVERSVGPVPIMVGSKQCHLRHLTREQLVSKGHEDARDRQALSAPTDCAR